MGRFAANNLASTGGYKGVLRTNRSAHGRVIDDSGQADHRAAEPCLLCCEHDLVRCQTGPTVGAEMARLTIAQGTDESVDHGDVTPSVAFTGGDGPGYGLMQRRRA